MRQCAFVLVFSFIRLTRDRFFFLSRHRRRCYTYLLNRVASAAAAAVASTAVRCCYK